MGLRAIKFYVERNNWHKSFTVIVYKLIDTKDSNQALILLNNDEKGVISNSALRGK